ncbi:MAG: hypothetical protein KGI03_01020 [Patescibacteria group bacterium]|nr:hypothetical protein [Patescibacteria group bacterium]
MARTYGISFDRYWATISCEDPSLDPLQQSLVPDPTGPNGRENSWGLAQIDLDFHPEISKKQAQDAIFALDHMARDFSSGNTAPYHCYKKLHESR